MPAIFVRFHLNGWQFFVAHAFFRFVLLLHIVDEMVVLLLLSSHRPHTQTLAIQLSRPITNVLPPPLSVTEVSTKATQHEINGGPYDCAVRTLI